MSGLRRLFQDATDAAAMGFIRAKLWLLDRILGPFPETPTDRAIREEGERLRKAFPDIDSDNPRRGVPRPHHQRK